MMSNAWRKGWALNPGSQGCICIHACVVAWLGLNFTLWLSAKLVVCVVQQLAADWLCSCQVAQALLFMGKLAMSPLYGRS
jgi:hypothetical protein